MINYSILTVLEQRQYIVESCLLHRFTPWSTLASEHNESKIELILLRTTSPIAGSANIRHIPHPILLNRP